MSDSEVTSAVSMMKKLKRIRQQVQDIKEQVADQRAEENAAAIDYDMVQEMQDQIDIYKDNHTHFSESLYEMEDETGSSEDNIKSKQFRNDYRAAKLDCKCLLSARIILTTTEALEDAAKCLVTAFEAEPGKIHEEAAQSVKELSKELIDEMRISPLPERHELKQRAKDARQQASLILGNMSPDKSVEVKPAVVPRSATKGGVKVKPMDMPEFSGRTEDWPSYYRLFKNAVNTNPDLETGTKLHYLVQSLQDPIQRETYAERMDEDGAYDTFLAELVEKYDKPRWMHRRYCQSLKELSTNQHTREGLTELVSEVTKIHNGLLRLKATDAKQILTSMTESIKDSKLRELWSQRTDKVKQTPPISELLQFITEQANQMEDIPKKNSAPVSKDYKNERKQRFQPRYKGSSHTTAPTAAPTRSSQPRQQNPQSGSTGGKSYVCSVCQENNLLFFCPLFEAYTTAQRKEHVMAHKLCLNCLKPYHMAKDCRAIFRCKAPNCGRKHSTLLHDNRAVAPVTQGSHQSNAVIHTDDSDEEELKDFLLMTSQVTITGPTGKFLTVRALLDSGSTLSILATRAMKYLKLDDTGKTVSISGVASNSTNRRHPLAKVTLTSQFIPEWKRNIMVAGMDEVTRHMSLQEASDVRSLTHIKDLELADQEFDRPGKIELLLGQDICRQIFLPGIERGTKREPEAWKTVFGWTISGTYSTSSKAAEKTAITHTVSTNPELELPADVILKKFFELEEPPSLIKKIMSPTEEQVEKHFEDTHAYIQSQKRYLVRLPRVNDTITLGESKTMAENRAKSNERSLIKKGRLPEFQKVMLEYLELGHARLVSDSMNVAVAEVYYMPVHSVIKESSMTTKCRAVFDASALSTNKISLNDMLAVGPTLHPTLDHILLKFRGYAVAITADITKMYREVLLHPKDRALHRYIWRPDMNSAFKEYEMTRVTFGVTASPYLAVKVLQQVANDFGVELPSAKWHLLNSFYVDDLMGGADSEEKAVELYNDLSEILQNASFTLKKWRSSSTKILKDIPVDAQEKLPLQDLVDMHSASYPKALGVTWNSREDNMSISTNIESEVVASKRGIISAVARTFDVLGWVSLVILPMKVLYREVWKTGVDWDDSIEEKLEERYRRWRRDLPQLIEIKIPRHYFRGRIPIRVEIHGYSDASEEAFGAVIYVRALYADGPPSSQLVMSKTRVAPPKVELYPNLSCAELTYLQN